MFFDEYSMWPRKEDLPPRKPAFRHEKALSRIILFYLLLLLLMPVSLGGAVDLIRYLLG